MATDTIRVIARIQGHPNSIKDLKKILTGLVEPSRGEIGCRRYELWQNSELPTDFAMVEEWEGETAFHAHLQSPHVAEALSTAGHLLLGEVDIRQYRLVE